MSSTPKQTIYAHLAEIAQALGHANRLELLEHLAQGRRSVETLSGLTGLSFANTSRHLQLLRRARLVDTERQGKHVLYRLAGDTEVVSVISALGRLGERNVAEVDQVIRDYFNQRDSLEPVSRNELLKRIEDGTVSVLDVRPGEEFALGHVPGALSIPMEELERRLAELPKDKDIIAYCRGPYCVMSFEAVATLRRKGYRVRRLEEGFAEWKAAGLAVSTQA
ncbi:ArsR family transcriptional regulator [Pseudoxanthomonas japonensis]|uniref:ArsR/SmtB family transcription factor n=1 Tax=Pseudoxanthomonas TaxID=83618 RepID=UPI0007806FE2|nr:MULTISPECIES: metalloregulator ArsR/SmtB family transcription factor [Pseudoxanthomonas]MDR7070349.1 ArsR family transcriptional regulator [Pseudoxanthomonas japonensis]